uniref:Uncharacterized protein n=1 Tax=Aegilops tauschii subsp. strangulata TaxID=200361 RepID=A0A453CAS8_AEGTS
MKLWVFSGKPETTLAVFDESRMYGLEGDLSYLSRSTLQYGVKKPKN